MDVRNDYDNLFKKKKDSHEMRIRMHADFEELIDEHEGLQIKNDEARHELCDVQNDLHKEGKVSKVQNKESKDRCKRIRKVTQRVIVGKASKCSKNKSID